jgi:hypothetical protein
VIDFFIAAGATFVGLFIFVPLLLIVLQMFGLYTIIQEQQCKVYMLFGKVVLVLKEPGLHFLISQLTWRAPLVHWLGRSYTLDLRLDQTYQRCLSAIPSPICSRTPILAGRSPPTSATRRSVASAT